MTTPRIAIVGGGLSGLYAAYLLTQAGIDFRVLEARDRLGGRIHSSATPASSGTGTATFDLGPSWFWPEFQPLMRQLTADLGLTSFAQYIDGDTLVERSRSQPPQRGAGYLQGNLSLRIAGGTGALIQALAAKINPSRLLPGHRVEAARLEGDDIHLDLDNTSNTVSSLTFSHLLLAAPPRLMADSLTLQPEIELPERQRWADTATWMAPHAKYVAVFDEPFWRKQGLSGTARSLVGPLVEVHDATSAEGTAALFGFIGLPANARQSLGGDALRQHCRTQLGRLFGPQAAAPRYDYLKDWATDTLTATEADQEPGDHPTGTADLFQVSGAWAGRLLLIASEAALEQPGYMEGALQAVRRIQPMLERLQR